MEKKLEESNIHIYMCVCVCVCMYMYISICVYAYVHTHTHISMYVCTHTQMNKIVPLGSLKRKKQKMGEKNYFRCALCMRQLGPFLIFSPIRTTCQNSGL